MLVVSNETITMISGGRLVDLPARRSRHESDAPKEEFGLPIDEEVRRINAHHALRERERRRALLTPVSEDGTNTRERTKLITYQGFFPLDFH